MARRNTRWLPFPAGVIMKFQCARAVDIAKPRTYRPTHPLPFRVVDIVRRLILQLTEHALPLAMDIATFVILRPTSTKSKRQMGNRKPQGCKGTEK